MTTQSSQLHVYRIDSADNTVFVIATSKTDAWAVALLYCDVDTLYRPQKCTELGDDTLLTVRNENGTYSTKTCSEWSQRGRGVIAGVVP